ncbi:unnamed protein product, partial [marine sediment metagenome]
ALSLGCLTNGGKIHEHFLRKYIVKSPDAPITRKHWTEYQEKAGDTKLREDEKLMLPFLMDESVPLCRKGIIRDGFGEDDAEANIRSLPISQILSMRLHSGHLSKVRTLCIVAGGSKDPFLRQMITDIFNADSYTIVNSDFAAPFGCAVAGARTLLKIPYGEAVDRFVQRDLSTCSRPVMENVQTAEKLVKRYAEFERKNIREP